jgi:hypothetical protein
LDFLSTAQEISFKRLNGIKAPINKFENDE